MALYQRSLLLFGVIFSIMFSVGFDYHKIKYIQITQSSEINMLNDPIFFPLLGNYCSIDPTAEIELRGLKIKIMGTR